MADFLGRTLEEIDELDLRVHALQKHMRARLLAIRLCGDSRYLEKIREAEVAVAAGDLGERDDADLLERYHAQLLADA